MFSLHSRPGADQVIYLDFDGHTTTGTSWNNSYGTTLLSPPYNIDGNSEAWSASEITRINDVWRIVSEDFAPFDIDVTTEEPPLARLMQSGAGDTQWGVRVVITADVWAGCGCGGFAYINSFNWSSDTPVFVFNSGLSGVAEASSHEVGHGLGLAHDGTSAVTYYYGHGTGQQGWAPIMGAGYNRIVTQFSRGEYYLANNNTASGNYGKGADDLAVITTYNGFGYRPDDHGDTSPAASNLAGSPASASGVIETTDDVDVFAFTTAGGTVTFDIDPVALRPNINLAATLTNSSGGVVAFSDPATVLDASFNVSLAAGTYYLAIDGAGMGDPLVSPPTGHAEYGNIGQYTVTGTFPTAASTYVAVIGDFGDDSTAEGDVAALVNGWSLDAIVTAGDNRYGSTTFDQVVDQFYCDFLTDAAAGSSCSGGNSAMNRFFPSTGNHDYTDGGGISEYRSYFTLPGTSIASSNTSGNERYYDYVVGPIHFFSIDTQGALTDGADMTAQQNWLQTQLAASTSPWQVVVMHHPPYSSGEHQSSTAMRWPYASWGADAVVASHDHNYERISASGIPYFVNGLGGRSIRAMGATVAGSQVRYNGDYGAMRIEADTGQMTFQFINLSGAVVDSHTVVPAPPGVIDVAISSGDDDVEERASDGVLDFTSSDIELGEDVGFNGVQTVGLLFRGVAVPDNSTITAAYLEFTTDETDSVTANVVIRAEDADNAASFAAVVNDVTGRTTTSASVSWPIPAWGTIGATNQSPDLSGVIQEVLSGVIQEVIDRGGWAQGNNIAFVIDGSGERTAESYNGSPGEAVRLHIEYSPNDPPTAEFTSATTDLTVFFTDASTDSDESLVSWDWDFGDSSSSTLQDPGHTYGSAGTYTASLTVTDNSGAADIISHPVTVTDPPQPNDPPTADFTSSNSDLTALFTDTSTDTDGTVVSWDWDFGDSGTLTAQNPSHAYAAEGTYTVWLTATDDDGDSHSVSHPMTVNDPPPPPDGGLYMSFDGNVTLGGTAATEEDILLWDGASAYSMAFDGSDVGLSGFNIDGFDVIGAGQVLISFESAETVPGVGAVDDSDIVLLTGTLGSATSGTFSMYFDGSDVSLSSGGEDIVALALLSDGSLLVSTNNSFSVAGLSGIDEDVIRFTGTFGPSTSGSFSMYFDGSDVAMSDKKEDIDALGTDGTDLYFSTIGNFNALGLTGADEDVLAFSGTFFPSTSGSFASFWDGSANGTTVDLNGLDVVEGGEDTTPPGTSIDSGPVEGSVLGVSSASLGFSATEPGSTFECSVDGGAFSSCASPVVLSGLVDGAHSFAVAATDATGNTDLSPATRNWTVDTTPPPPGGGLYFAFKTDVSIGGVTVDESDILHWDGASTYTQTFDGSDVGLGGFKISGFDVIGPDQVLLTFVNSDTVPGLGNVDDSDVVLFTGTLGPATSGTFTMYFDGSDVQLDQKKESIRALTLLDDGSLLISTQGSFSVSGLSGEDKDVFRFTGVFGSSTSGSFSMYLDGSDVGMSNKKEDVDALASDGTDLYFSTTGDFSAGGVVATAEDVITFSGTFGDSTSGTFGIFWDAAAHGIAADIVGLDLG